MPKANRTCYCCGKEYYYCPSCPDDRRDPRIFVMWDSEKCREIFNILTNESTNKITTLECKNKLIELGVTKDTVLRESVRKHVDRVMSYQEKTEEAVKKVIEEVVQDAILEIEIIEENEKLILEEEQLEENNIETVVIDAVYENIKKNRRTKRSSLKNKENSEVD